MSSAVLESRELESRYVMKVVCSGIVLSPPSF
jgi:hypothetical protein